jgi:hypothetical protein
VRLHLETLETRYLLTGYRPIDEVGNNQANPTWGAAPADQPNGAPIQLLRSSPVAYADGISAPSLPDNPSARLASDNLNNQADPANPSQDLQTVSQESLSDFGYVFGQFLDHDLDLTLDGGASFPIDVPPGDPIGPDPLPFTRSQYDPTTGTSTSNPRQQVNSITSFLDLSQVYGSDAATADALRTHAGGRLKTSPGNELPYDNSTYFTASQLAAINAAEGGMANQGFLPNTALFVTGDVRGNENIELTALQTLFVRNHNRLADQLHVSHPLWGDEQLYQEARLINIAQYQVIAYTQYIPDILGPNALPAYAGYDPTVNPSISTEFSTVAFRFGHSMLSNQIQRHTNRGLDINAVGGAPINLAVDFFDANLINPSGAVDPLTGQSASDIGPVLKGDADGNGQATDPLVVNEVRSLLFGNGQGGMDLLARDIQRDRDHGIGTYNQLRVAYGLPPVTSFADITGNVLVQQALQATYGSVDNIDPFEGGLAEDHAAGATVGPLFERIMADQFTRLRDGDSYFYLNQSFTPQEQSLIQQGDTLAKIIRSNTNVTNLQGDVFRFRASISGTVSMQLGSGVPGVTVLLEDTSGDVLGTTVTDDSGGYRFDQLSGPAADPENGSGVSATGYYDVALVLPPDLQQVTPNPPDMLISRGGTNVSGVDFGVVTLSTSDGSTGLPASDPTGAGGAVPGAATTPAPALNAETPAAPARVTGTDLLPQPTVVPVAEGLSAPSAAPTSTPGVSGGQGDAGDALTGRDGLSQPFGDPVLA